MVVCNGPVHAAVPSLPSLSGGLEMQTRRDKCQEMYASHAWPGLLLSHPVSRHVRSATLNHSTRDRLTAPSLTGTEMKSPRTLMTESASKTLSHISFRIACTSGCKAVKFPVNFFLFF